jgi:hypothetical protein
VGAAGRGERVGDRLQDPAVQLGHREPP